MAIVDLLVILFVTAPVITAVHTIMQMVSRKMIGRDYVLSKAPPTLADAFFSILTGIITLAVGSLILVELEQTIFFYH